MTLPLLGPHTATPTGSGLAWGAAGPIVGTGAVTLTGGTGFDTPIWPSSNLATVEGWAYLPAQYNANPRLIASDHTDANPWGLEWFVNGTGGVWNQVVWQIGNGVNGPNVTMNTPPPIGAWFYWAGSLLAGAPTCTMALVLNEAYLTTSPVPTGIIPRHPLSIGYNPAYRGDYVHGALAHVAYYTNALPLATLTARPALAQSGSLRAYQAAVLADHPFAYWPMVGAGPFATDRVLPPVT